MTQARWNFCKLSWDKPMCWANLSRHDLNISKLCTKSIWGKNPLSKSNWGQIPTIQKKMGTNPKCTKVMGTNSHYSKVTGDKFPISKSNWGQIPTIPLMFRQASWLTSNIALRSRLGAFVSTAQLHALDMTYKKAHSDKFKWNFFDQIQAKKVQCQVKWFS